MKSTALIHERELRPRVWELDVGAPDVSASAPRDWCSSARSLERLGNASGSALALALLLESARQSPAEHAPLVIAVGECVRRGVPTAARASIASRAPLTGRFAQGQVGSDLGRRLASLTDALVLRGRTDVAGAVLHLDGEARARIVAMPELRGAASRRVHEALVLRFGPCASLSIGLAGERELSVASLAAGGDPPHFVGRGGLGAVLGRLGLKAIAVSAPPVAAEGSAELMRAMLSSGRLESRAEGGTLELFSASAARGEISAARAVALEREITEARTTRHGCAGCPTPCGWKFVSRAGASERGARFGATRALGTALGLERFEDALLLLARCDDFGVDAKEIGAGLAVLCLARGRGRLPAGAASDRRAELEHWLSEFEAQHGEGAWLAGGAAALARRLGLEDESLELLSPALGEDLAALLFHRVSPGVDPTRGLGLLSLDGADATRLRRLVHPLPLHEGAHDARLPIDKGRLVWWHENLSAALDATGFCAFSAAALLADFECTLDQLAEWILPRERLADADDAAPGERLLALGEEIVLLQRLLDEQWGAPRLAPPPGSREQLALRGMEDEYRALRGLDAHGRLAPETLACFDRGERRDVARFLADAPPAASASAAPLSCEAIARGRVRLRASGPLARALGRERELELCLPATVELVLREAASAEPAAAEALWKHGRALPAVYRDGRRLALEDQVEALDVLDLVLVISGGAG